MSFQFRRGGLKAGTKRFAGISEAVRLLLGERPGQCRKHNLRAKSVKESYAGIMFTRNFPTCRDDQECLKRRVRRVSQYYRQINAT